MLRRIQLRERLLKRGGVGGDLRILDALVSGGQPRIGDLDPHFNRRELARFQLGEFLLATGLRGQGIGGDG